MSATCRSCGKRRWAWEMNSDRVCRTCLMDSATETRATAALRQASFEAREAAAAAVSLSTEALAPFTAERLGIVAAEAALGINILKDLLVEIRNIAGGRSATLQAAMRDARRSILTDIRSQALALGADAVVAIDIDLIEASHGTMLLMTGTGTAVRRIADRASDTPQRQK